MSFVHHQLSRKTLTSVLVFWMLALSACGGGPEPDSNTPTTLSAEECVALYDATDAFDYLPKPITPEQQADLDAINERIENEC